MREDDKEKKADFGFDFFRDIEKFSNYRRDIEVLISEVDEYKRFADASDLADISFKDVGDLFRRGSVIYSKALGLYLVSQPEYTFKIDEYVRSGLRESANGKIDEVFIALASSPGKSCLEKERVDWLKIVLLAIGKNKEFERIKSDHEFSAKISSHVGKYKYYSASAEFGLWDEAHYWKLMESDFEKGKESLLEEYEEIANKKESVLKKRQDIIEKYGIDKETQEITMMISELGLLRIDFRILGWQFFNYLFPLLIDESAKMAKCPKEIVRNLSYMEYVEFLENEGNLNDVGKEKAEQNTLVFISDKSGYEIFYGEEADVKFDQDVKEIAKTEILLKGAVGYRQGVITGNVFLFRWGSDNFNERIYDFPKGSILVAGQTRPLLMPAIRKAKAIITDEGGLLCHAAIVSRELKIPCIIGTKMATKFLHDGDLVEVDTDKGTIKVLKRNV
ncbi:MAG TPA: hypothetical protein DD454_00720 [Candidatus Moranbacteria bacterium]|nr:hypothetical protein [Candidatus Moranbacteria bacterium]